MKEIPSIDLRTVLSCVRAAASGRMARSKAEGGMRMLLGWLGGMVILEAIAATLFLWSSAGAHASRESFHATLHLHALVASLPAMLVIALSGGLGGLGARLALHPARPLDGLLLKAAAPFASSLSAGLAGAVLPLAVASPLAASSPGRYLASAAWYLAFSFCCGLCIRSVAIAGLRILHGRRDRDARGGRARGFAVAGIALAVMALMNPQDRLEAGRATVLVFQSRPLDPGAIAAAIPSPREDPAGAWILAGAAAALAAVIPLLGTARRGFPGRGRAHAAAGALARIARAAGERRPFPGEPLAGMLTLVAAPRTAILKLSASAAFSVLSVMQGAAPLVPAAAAALAFLLPAASALARLSTSAPFHARVRLLPVSSGRAELSYLAAATLHGTALALPLAVASLILA